MSILYILIVLRLLIYYAPTPFYNLYFISALIAINLAILIWQVIGALRAGDKHLKSENGSLAVMASYFTIVAACLLFALQTGDWLSGDQRVEITQSSLRTRPLPIVSPDQTKLYLDGPIDFELNTSFKIVLNENKSINTIMLNSNGGAIYAARAIANSIIENKLNTHIDKSCNSACTLIFMAGNNRSIGESGQIGFHQYKDDQMNPLKTDEINIEQEKDLAFFKSQGASEYFLKTLFQARHNEIWQPDASILHDEGIITAN